MFLTFCRNELLTFVVFNFDVYCLEVYYRFAR